MRYSKSLFFEPDMGFNLISFKNWHLNRFYHIVTRTCECRRRQRQLVDFFRCFRVQALLDHADEGFQLNLVDVPNAKISRRNLQSNRRFSFVDKFVENLFDVPRIVGVTKYEFVPRSILSRTHHEENFALTRILVLETIR